MNVFGRSFCGTVLNDGRTVERRKMALGIVQSGHAGAAYAYRRTTGVTEGFYSDLSAAVQRTEEECKNNSGDIGAAAIPYGEKTWYAAESASDDSKMQSTSAIIQSLLKNQDGDEESVDFMQFIRERMEEIFVLVQNGDTEPSFQIGGSSFTIKEWEEFLQRFDDVQDAIKELMREKAEKRIKEAKETEAAEGISALVSESTKCTFPSSVPGQEDIKYITCYTKEGIFCRKAGQSEGYEWTIHFENEEDYSKVMEFLDRFDREDNLRFAAHENFWQDFLKDEIDIEGFVEFFEGTDHGVPNYAISKGNSMYVGRDKMQWAKYMNPFGNRLYTREEMMKMQEELIEANKAKLTKLSNPYSRINQNSHLEYNGRKIFCEYPGGPLYTADEIAQKMMQNLLSGNIWRKRE